ncbi:hypothetical protein LOC68_25815 [Blastopirellula sp. JC732]|uniref:Uncharacterized protein n=1 Tax=Blastopirellula sediminis TaxID=2894196 RepID=A0A9X1SJ04_9BACT|nr:hypothetical protein [Blastopirellula sediminis]MCC9604874.1 hypothetical protein [Blastopirellula sediminis]MCC9631827.1 hypothetical protein [Blastopirellula sediminis]
MSQRPTDNSLENPFQSPVAPSNEYEVRGPGICPYCGQSDFERPVFTHWGGFVGPWLLNHAVCRHCQRGFNAGSGASNLLNIILYQIGSVVLVVAALLICIFYVLPGWGLL